jgi:hypothetical protein
LVTIRGYNGNIPSITRETNGPEQRDKNRKKIANHQRVAGKNLCENNHDPQWFYIYYYNLYTIMIYYDPQWFYRSSIYYYFYRTIEQTSIVAESSMVLYTMIYYG